MSSSSSPSAPPRHEPVIDSRIKSTHFVMKSIFSICRLFGAEPYKTFRKMLPLCPPKLHEGILSQDLSIPPVKASVFPKANSPLEEVKVRVYTHEGNTEKMPILLIYHGGGFVLGSVAQEPLDNWIRLLVKTAKVMAISVDYRLAPEHKFPAAIDDSLAAVLWAQAGEHPVLKEHGDSSRIVMLGESSGGNLVAVVNQVLAKDYPEVKVAHQVLISATMHLPDDKFTESRKKFADGYMLWKGMQDVNKPHYLPATLADEVTNTFLVQPLLGSNLGKLPSAHVVVGEADMLHDEGQLYAEALKAAGTEVKLSSYENSVHGFFGMQFLPEAQRAFADVIGVMKEKLV